MATVGTVIIDVKADTAKLVSGMDRAEKSVKKSVDSLKNNILGIGAAFLSIQTAMKAFEVGIDFTRTASQFEKFNTVLKTIEGSSAKANQSMDWISEFTKSTPYELANVTDSFVKLKAYGIDPTDGTLRTLGDTASAMGKSLNQAVEAMADAVTGENERLKEFGIKASKSADEITYNWTSASGKAKTITIENNSAIIQSTLEAIFNSKYEDAMDMQSKTLEGMLSNISDSYTIFQNNVMNEGLYDYIKAVTKVFGTELSKALEVTADNSKPFANTLIDAINSTILATGKLANALQGIGVFFKVTYETVSAAFNALVVTIVGGAATMIDSLNKLPGVNLDNSWSTKVSESAANSFRDNIDNINNSLDGIVDYEDRAVKFVNDSTEAFRKFQLVADNATSNKPRAEIGTDAKSGSESDAAIKKRMKLEEDWKELLDNNYLSALDSQIALAESTNDWNDGLTGVAGNIMAISKSMSKFRVDELKSTKAQFTLEKKYEQDREKFKNSPEKLAILEKQYAKDSKALKEASLQNELQGYSQMAGAMSNMFEQGSKEAAAFNVVQNALALSAAVTSIASAGAGDPYTAIPRIIAMTATMASLLSNIGVALGTNQTVTSYDAFSAQAENTGTGSVFGEPDEQSQSIANSLEIMSDYAEPQYQAIVRMSDSILQLNGDITKFTNQAVRTGATSSYFNDYSFEGSMETLFKESGAASFVGNIASMFTFGLGDFLGITSALSSVFGGGGYTEMTDYGARFNQQLITSAMESISANSYKTIHTHKDGGWFSSDSDTYKTTFGSLDKTLKENMSMVLGGVYDSVILATEAIGLDRVETIEDLSDFMIMSSKISFDKSGTAIEKDFTAYISNITDRLAADALNGILDDYRQVGEGLFETLSRVATEVTVVTGLLDVINTMPVDNILLTSQNLIELSGSLDEFSNMTNSYYDDYFSDAEKLEDTTQMLSGIFSDLGIAMPSTYEGFRNIVETLDLNTESGQSTYITMMRIADSFTEVADASKTLLDANEELISGLLTFANNMLYNSLSAEINYGYSMTMLSAALNGFASSTDKAQSSTDIQSYAANAVNYINSSATSLSEQQYQTALIANRIKDTVALNDNGSFKTVEERIIEMKDAIVAELQDINANTEREYA